MEDPMLSVAIPWGEGEEIYGGIILHAPIEGIERTFAQMRETILWATLFGVVLSTAMVSYLSWSISRPLQKIERTATEIGRGNYAERVKVDTADEISDLAQTINTLAEKLERVEQERHHLEQVRNDFLANVSHELRTPLTAIQGFLEALQDGLVEEEEARQKYYAVMYSETMQINRLVDDLMDLMKLENNEVTLARFPVDVAEVINKTAFAFRPEAAEKGLEIVVELADALPKIYADKDRVAQIVKNLVKNAVKFTDEGTIRITAEPEGEWVRMSVADTGIGIAADDLPRIWERFFKVDRGRSKKNKGTGLGLAIVKELVELHDGNITVESEPGLGTTFTVWLPTVEKYRQAQAQ
jgi:signal transduction histidine kinase